MLAFGIRERADRVVFHTREEIDKLLAAFPSDAWRLVVLLGADAGLRRGEMANLKWEDVDFDNNQLYIASNKTEHYSFVPMTGTLQEALEKARTRAKHEYVVDVPTAQRRPLSARLFDVSLCRNRPSRPSEQFSAQIAAHFCEPTGAKRGGTLYGI